MRRLFFSLLFVTVFGLTGLLGLAQAGTLEWTTNFANNVKDETGADLAVGSLVQLILAGTNSQIDPPNMDGSPGGDDTLLTALVGSDGTNPTTIGGMFGDPGVVYAAGLVYDDANIGKKVYTRVFNGATAQAATMYGDSALYTLLGTMGEQFDITPTASFATSIVMPKPAPVVSSIAPSSGATVMGTPVVISGSNFIVGAKVFIGTTEIASGTMQVVNDTTINALVPAGIAVGPNPVKVQNPDGQNSNLDVTFTVLPALSFTKVEPNSGAQFRPNDVAITGTGFTSGTVVTIGGNAVIQQAVSSDTTITATFPSLAVNKYEIKLQNPDGQIVTAVDAFEVNSPPAITLVGPNGGQPNQTTNIAITGTDFTTGATVMIGNTAATGVTVVSQTSITATVPAGLKVGVYEVTVTNPDTQSASLAGAYTVAYPQGFIAVTMPAQISGTPGATLNVPISINESAGIMAWNMLLTYDPLVLSYDAAVGVTKGDVSMAYDSIMGNEDQPGQLQIGGLTMTPTTGGGVLVNVPLKVSVQAVGNLTANLSFLDDPGNDLRGVDPSSTTIATQPRALTVGSFTGRPGDEFSVPISINEVAGVAAFNVKIVYDANLLEPGQSIGGGQKKYIDYAGTLTENFSLPPMANAGVPGAIEVGAVTDPPPTTASGVLFNVLFTIRGTATGTTLITLDPNYKNDDGNQLRGSIVVITGGTVTIQDVAAPTVTAFNVDDFSKSLTVAVTLFTATDNVGVTGYLLTEAATAPAADNPNWSATAPASYNFASAGVKTLYAWAKDAAGNVSAALSDTITVDTTAPTVTVFTLPANSTTLNVAFTALAATDTVGVTGYMVTESATAPGAADIGWNATAPASYTFTTAGPKTLYAWAKDAAGNVSASQSASVNVDITEPTVTAFDIPATSKTLVVPIITLTATDNVGIAAYMVTESATPPGATDTGWSATVPASFTFATEGTKTLYAWAKDAAGKVSTTVVSDQVIIELKVLQTITISELTNKSVVQAGYSLQFKAMGTYDIGAPEEITQKVLWNSSSPNVAEIFNGRLFARAAGTTQVTATMDNKTSNALTITVTAAVPLTITTPDNQTLRLGSTLIVNITGGSEMAFGQIMRGATFIGQLFFENGQASFPLMPAKLGANYAGKYTVTVQSEGPIPDPKSINFYIPMDIVPAGGVYYVGDIITFRAYGTTDALDWTNSDEAGTVTQPIAVNPQDSTMATVTTKGVGSFTLTVKSLTNPTEVKGATGVISVALGGFVKVTVTNAADNTAIAGASVFPMNVDFTSALVDDTGVPLTDADGVALIKGLPTSRSLVFLVWANGFANAKVTKDASGKAIKASNDAAKPTEVTASLTATTVATIVISGNVVDIAGNGVPSALVTIAGTLGNLQSYGYTTEARAGGAYSFTLPLGAESGTGSDLTLTASAPNYGDSASVPLPGVKASVGANQLTLNITVSSGENPSTRVTTVKIFDLSGTLTPANTALAFHAGSTHDGVLSPITAKGAAVFQGVNTPAHLSFTYTPGAADTDGALIDVDIQNATLPGGEHVTFLIHPKAPESQVVTGSVKKETTAENGTEVGLNGIDKDGDGTNETADNTTVVIQAASNLQDAQGNAVTGAITVSLSRTEGTATDASARYNLEIKDAAGKRVDLQAVPIDTVPPESRLLIRLQFDPDKFDVAKFLSGEITINYLDQNGVLHSNDGTYTASLDGDAIVIESSHASVWFLGAPAAAPPAGGEVGGGGGGGGCFIATAAPYPVVGFGNAMLATTLVQKLAILITLIGVSIGIWLALGRTRERKLQV